jgi:hypothetical protein
MTRQTMFGLAALSLLVLAVANSSTLVRGQQDAPAIAYDDVSLFKDKIVLIEFNDAWGMTSSSDTVLVNDVRTFKIGDRQFIVGTGYAPKDEQNIANKDMEVGIPCDRVYRITAMNAEQCETYMRKWREKLQEE